MTQRDLFGWADEHRRDLDLKRGEELKEQGMKAAADAKPSLLSQARDHAYRVCCERGWVTADDCVSFELGPAAGSIFRDSRFQFSGRRIRSRQPNNHARELKVWVLK